jgi:hypothetical protein
MYLGPIAANWAAFAAVDSGVFVGSEIAFGNFVGAAVGGFASGAIASGNIKGGLQGAFTAGAFDIAGDYINGQGLFSGGQRVEEASFTGVTVHGIVGCITSMASGGKCGPGLLSAAFSQAALPYKPTDFIGGTITSMTVGGTVSVLGGGKFANGATTAAMGYIFNFLPHVHLALSFEAGNKSGILNYAQMEALSNLTVAVDTLPDSQDPGRASWHGMCDASQSVESCGRQMIRYVDQQWEAKSPEALARLLHMDEDGYAPMHRGGQSYDGFSGGAGQAISHGLSDRAPPVEVQSKIILREAILIRDYNTNCGGCISSWKPPPPIHQ